MADKKLAKLLETQISLTEWLAQIGHNDTEKLREEDNVKRTRLGELNTIINLPYDKPTTFAAADIAKRTKAVQKFIDEHGRELCALRLMPKKGVNAEKLRNRGQTVRDVLTWFDNLDINYQKYIADFVPHIEDYSWATIFVVNQNGIFGEIYKGGHHILTQGLAVKSAPILFQYDFKQWQLQPHNDQAFAYLKKLIGYIHVAKTDKQKVLKQKLKAEFAHNYLKGYFETTHSETRGTWFIDYNRLLGEKYKDFVIQTTGKASKAVLNGKVACTGKAAGTAHIITDPSNEDIKPGEILVCEMTSPDYIPLMMKAGGLITDHGGILCHAAIVARELGLPCIVGTQKATKVLKTGDKVVLDLVNGEVSK